MNTDHIRALIAKLLNLKAAGQVHLYDQQRFIRLGDPDSLDTPTCIAGWAYRLSGWNRRLMQTYSQLAQTWLGLNLSLIHI